MKRPDDRMCKFNETFIITHQENVASQCVALKAGFKMFRQFKGSDRYTRKMRDYIEFRYERGDDDE